MIKKSMEISDLPEQAVMRELGEELGLAVSIDTFIGHYIFEAKNQLIIAYAVNGKGINSLRSEIADIQLVTKRKTNKLGLRSV